MNEGTQRASANAVQHLIDFIDGAPSPYHAVHQARTLLQQAGFSELSESERWSIEPGGGYFLVRGGKTLIAWRAGGRAPSETGFRIIASHGDSPALKLRPRPMRRVRDVSYLTTEVYGSPLLHTWLDRDLKLAGAIYVREPQAGVRAVLVDLREPVVRLNSLAPHLKKERKIDGVQIDQHNDVLAAVAQQEETSPVDAVDRLAAFAGVAPDDVLTHELFLADVQPAALVGERRAFISAPRLDNLFSSYCALRALLAGGLVDHTPVAVLYDAEEIGSLTWTGARSNVLEATLSRLCAAYGGDTEDTLRARARSIVVSADMAHGEHPSFVDVTDAEHVPQLNHGLAIKSGAKGNYAIGHLAAAWFEMVCRAADIPLQRFMYRCDHGGGSSVGPIVSAGLGVCGVDVGAPMLAMHSIREMAGARDVELTLGAFAAFYATPDRFGA